jgi:hypothetical protein
MNPPTQVAAERSSSSWSTGSGRHDGAPEDSYILLATQSTSRIANVPTGLGPGRGEMAGLSLASTDRFLGSCLVPCVAWQVDSWPPDCVLSRSTESSEGQRWRCLGSINVALRPEWPPEGAHCSKLSMSGSAWVPQAQFSRKCEDTTSAPGLGQDPRLRRCRTARGSPDQETRQVERWTRTPALQGPVAALTVHMKSQRARGCLFLGSDVQEKPRGPSRSQSRGDGDGHGHGRGSSWSEAPFYFGRRKRPTVNLDFAFPRPKRASPVCRATVPG